MHPRRPQPSAQPSSLIPSGFFPHPFPATPLHPRRPQPSAQPSSLISSGFISPHISSHPLAPTPSAASAQPSSLIPSGFFSPPISSHPLAPTPSAPVRAAELAHPQRLLLPTHFQPPPPCTDAVRSRPRSKARSSPAASSPYSYPAFSLLSLPFPSFPFLSLPFPSFSFLSLPFPSFPLRPHRRHTTVQSSSLPTR